MKNAKRYSFTRGSAKILFKSFLASLAIAGVCAAQSPPLLEITSPPTGTVVNPGQTISVTVTSPAGASFQMVAVIGQDPFPSSGGSGVSVPAQFSLTVPTADISCQTYVLSASGVTSSGQGADSARILIDVERPDLPTALSLMNPGPEIFEALGDQDPLTVLATFSDGSVFDVTNSTYVTFSSSNTSIATVNSTGMVTAGVTGSGTITATYTVAGQSVQLPIPVTVEPPVMLVTPPSLDFGSQDVGTASAAQQLTVTNQLHGPMKILSVSAKGDFSETDDCGTSSPLAPGGSCTVNVTFTPTVAGPGTGSVSIHNSFSGPSIAALRGTGLGQPTTTTSLASSANPSLFGQSVTLTASVTPSSGGTATGTVTFNDGATVLGAVPLVNGQAAFTSSSFAVGPHSITASYSGDSAFQASAGALTETVNPASTQTTVSSSANPAILNSTVTFTATVAVVAPGAGTPTGNITFNGGSTALGTVPINSAGQATLATSSLAAGAHSITAAYAGDANFNPSTSSALNQSVHYEPAGTACDGDAGHQILQPISAGGTSVYNQGRTVPAKFRVCDANGVSVGAPGVVTSFLLTETVSGKVTTTVEDVVNTDNPDSAFRWDATGQQWIFNISTQNLSAGETYVYTITLNDGTAINFQYGLR